MNQDFTVKKKQYLSEKKKLYLERFTWKKNPLAEGEKKKFVQAENSPSPPPPISFLMVRPLARNPQPDLGQNEDSMDT